MAIRRILIILFIGLGYSSKMDAHVDQSPRATQSTQDPQTLFIKLSPEQTGITFSNTITETPEFNNLLYPFMYNGAGVAIGDINNNGYLDVYQSQLRPHVDMQFIAGINHTIYHGTTYSPQEETWPGWKFYASTHFAPANTFWDDLGDFNRYMANSQSFLQAGNPANDILLYFPIHDLWHADTSDAGTPYYIRYHNPDDWFYGTNLGNTAEILWKRGYAFDYISDRQIKGLEARNHALHTGNARYQAIVVPDAKYMPLETLNRLMEIAESGGTVIFKNNLPMSVPGFYNFEDRQNRLDDAYGQLHFRSLDRGIRKAEIGNGQILKGENTEYLLSYVGIHREPVADTGLNYIRRRHENGHYYFISNLHVESVNSWIPLATEAESVMIFDPYSEKSGLAWMRHNNDEQSEVYLQLKPGESRVLKTYRSFREDAENWVYYQDHGQPVAIEGNWKIEFKDGGPVLPGDIDTEQLASWTDLEGRDTERFAGTARYSIEFQRPDIAADAWRMSLGKVAESAVVYLNGEKLASVWSHPFELTIENDLLQDADNVLEIDVTNLMINRIIDMDRQNIRWQKFYDINMVNINYQSFDASGWEPMESGLIGPVQLIPLNETGRD